MGWPPLYAPACLASPHRDPRPLKQRRELHEGETPPFVDRPLFEGAVMAAVLVNVASTAYALEDRRSEDWCARVDELCIGFFVLEMLLRVRAHRAAFFRDQYGFEE